MCETMHNFFAIALYMRQQEDTYGDPVWMQHYACEELNVSD